MSEPISMKTLQDIPGATSPNDLHELQEPLDVGFSDQPRDNDPMCSEVVANFGYCTGFMQERGFQVSWDLAEVLLRAYVKAEKWKGSDQLRSHLGIPILAEQLYSLLSATQQGLFTGRDFFQIAPTSGTTLDVARAQQALIKAEVDMCGPTGGTLKQECRSVLFDGILYGTGAAFIGWKQATRTVIKKKRNSPPTSLNTGIANISIPTSSDDELIDDPKTFTWNQPVFEHVPLRRLRFAPDCRRSQVNTATWAGRLIYLTSYQLDEMRDVEGYNIPTREQLVALTTPFKTTQTEQNPLDNTNSSFPNNSLGTPQKAWPEYYDEKNNVDPLAQKWEVKDYWTNTRHVMVLEDQFVIYNESHDFGTIPMLTFNFREAPDSLLGYGLVHLIGNFQKIASGICNGFFDDLTLNLMGTYSRPRGLNSSAQSEFVFPGKVFQFDTSAVGGINGSGGFQQLSRNAVSVDMLGVINTVKGWAASLTGVGTGISGSNTGATGDLRTAAGANLLAGGESVKLQDFIDQFCDLIIVPFLKFCVEQNRRLTPKQVQEVLSNELQSAFTGDPLDIINGDYKVTVNVASRLAAVREASKAFGFILQALQSPGLTQQLETQGKKVLYDNFFKLVLDTTGLDYDQIIGDMTDEDKQRTQQAMQQAQQQSKLGIIGAQTQAKIAVNENQSENRLLIKSGEKMLEKDDVPFEQQ